MTARGRESSRPRTFGISTSFIYLVCALSLGSAIFPFVSLRIYDQAFSLASTDAFEVYGTTSSDEWKCPIGWTQERCEQRKKEFWTQIAVNEKIRGDMIRAARQRARHNVYRRKQTESLKQDHDEYFQSVQRAVRVADLNTHNNTLQLPFPPWANFSNNSFADFSILGFPKAGTSQLYKLLVSHPNVEPVFKRKEYCIDHGHFLDYTLPQNLANPKVLRDLNKNLFQYHKRLFKQRTDHDQDEGRNQNLHRQLLVNACLQPQEVEYHMAYTAMPETSKYFLLFRDPADWLWASWNFWVDKNLDHRPPVDHDWASMGLHYRSPELFHELILSQESTMSAARRFRTMREQTVHVPRRLFHLVGQDRLLFLKSEEMKASNGRLPQFLQQLSDFTGLSLHDFDLTIAHGQTNCNAQKGFQNICNSTSLGSSSNSSGYPITHYRPMLEETRQLIYIQFWEECKVWAEEFDVTYPDCLHVVSDNVVQGNG